LRQRTAAAAWTSINLEFFACSTGTPGSSTLIEHFGHLGNQ
jgi:hypothetical protein